MRLFVSVDLPAVAAAVADLQSLFPGDGLRFTDPAQLHVTLKFLGHTDPDRLDSITAALDRAVATAGVDPFDVTVGGLGAFPSPEYINVIWVGIRSNGDTALVRLHEAVEAELVDLGFDPADHEFTPHATIARMDHAGSKSEVQTLLEHRDPDLGTQHVDAIHLTESTLTDTGPVYEHVHTTALE
ncbi:MAG: RNA 2',3'-cyclic phosphodiesterase [Halobacteriaceae archaeon]